MQVTISQNRNETMKNELILKGLIEGDHETFRYLHRQFGPIVLAHILRNNGCRDDYEDVFNLTLTTVWQKVSSGTYKEDGKFKQFFLAVAENKWLEELRYRRTKGTTTLEDHYSLADTGEEDLARAVVKDHRLNAIFQALDSWEDTFCKELIVQFHIKEVSLLEISQKTGYDYNNLRKRIFDCRKRLEKQALEILAVENTKY